MKYAISIILPFIVYFCLGWIAKDIYFSINPVTDIVDIYKNEILVYAIIAAVYNFFASLGASSEEFPLWLIMFCIPIASYSLLDALPMSEGATYLNLILCIGSMIVSGIASCLS